MLAACGDDSAPKEEPVDPACEPSESNPGDFRFVELSPSDISVNGGSVDLVFEGTLPSTLNIQGFQTQGGYVPIGVASGGPFTSPLRLEVPPLPALGTLGLDISGYPASGPALYVYLPCAATVVDAPPVARVVDGTSDLASALHPELARDCARNALFTLLNSGGGGVDLSPGTLPPTDGFSLGPLVDGQGASCEAFPQLGRNQQCVSRICFSSDVSGPHRARPFADVVPAPEPREVSALVLPPTDGLDPGFGSTGAVYWATALQDAPWTASDGPDGSVVLHSSRQFAVVGRDGRITETARPDGTLIGISVAAGEILALLDVSGVHLQRFDVEGRPAAEPVTLDRLIRGASMRVTSAGRVLVAGDTADGGAVCAYDRDGQIDADYGLQGCVKMPSSRFVEGAPPLSPASVSALDGSNRFIVGTEEGVARFDAEGALDEGLVVAGPAVALAVDLADDAVIIATAAGELLRFADGDAGVSIAHLAPLPQAIAVDPEGGVIAAFPTRPPARFHGGVTEPVGFAAAGDVASAVSCRDDGCFMAGRAPEAYVLRLVFP